MVKCIKINMYNIGMNKQVQSIDWQEVLVVHIILIQGDQMKLFQNVSQQLKI